MKLSRNSSVLPLIAKIQYISIIVKFLSFRVHFYIYFEEREICQCLCGKNIFIQKEIKKTLRFGNKLKFVHFYFFIRESHNKFYCWAILKNFLLFQSETPEERWKCVYMSQRWCEWNHVKCFYGNFFRHA